VLSSLARKPKPISSLHAILWTANVLSRSRQYERKLERKRMCDVKPESRIKNNENIWSLAVIDNIDFMEKTFAYGNIFDTTRRSVHATLRMLFQFEFSKPIKQILGVVQNITNPRDQRVLFGESIYTNNFLNTCEYILSDFLKKPRRDWDHN